MNIELNPTHIEAGFTAEKIVGRRGKGWPERSPKPYRLYRNGKFIAAFATLLDMIRNINLLRGAVPVIQVNTALSPLGSWR